MPRHTLRRCWINQPSELQPLHRLHGSRVLADDEGNVYFTDGNTVSADIPAGALSAGWPEHDTVQKLTRLILAGEALAEYWQNGTPVHACSDVAADFRAALKNAQS